LKQPSSASIADRETSAGGTGQSEKNSSSGDRERKAPTFGISDLKRMRGQ
jgi:hypothetical protein